MLTSYDGQSLLYDAIGNPLSYRNGLSFTWSNGRELATVINNSVNGSFTYNDSGIRTSKTYNGVITSYLLNGSSIVRQTQGESILDFFYDENGNLYGFQKGTSTYYYLRNGQNDIVGILDSNGIQVVSYTYDAWGNPLSVTGSLATTIGVENPFRYRGYYFDTETGLYYLNSRYYDSVTGRFINADGQINDQFDFVGKNIFAYTSNNPVNYSDTNGNKEHRNGDAFSTYSIFKNGYQVKTFIFINNRIHGFKYYIQPGGEIFFDFDENPKYGMVAINGYDDVLATEVLKSSMLLVPKGLEYRTLRGIQLELLGHYAVLVTNRFTLHSSLIEEHMVVANMGTPSQLGGTDPDCIYFEILALSFKSHHIKPPFMPNPVLPY